MSDRFGFAPANAGDFERLLALRLVALRESLERLDRFDPARARARARFSAEYEPEHMRLIEVEGALAGCVSLKPDGEAGFTVEHLYLHPEHQGRGLGGAVMRALLDEADAAGKPVRLGVLRQSDANRFYQRYGFAETHRDAFDNYYLRPARPG